MARKENIRMKSSGIGGQAVLEGVMMKNGKRYSVAVRKPDNRIEIKTDEFQSISDRIPLFRLPVFRGMSAFVESLVLGIRTLTWSAGFAEEGQEGKGEKESGKENRKEGKKAKETFADIGVVVLSVLMAVVVFILFPLAISSLLGKLAGSETVQLVLEGILRILMFVAYVALISRLNDIKRVFMYHGAEHKCINCVERGEELTVANVRRQSRCHKRCGTSFMLIVMLVSFVLFMFIRVKTAWLRYVLRIVLVPFIAGISYEFIRLAGSSDSKIVAALSKPGFLLQGLTTREPDDSMIEVAIISVEAVFDWRAYQQQEKIPKYLKRGKGKSKGKEKTEADKAAAASSGAVSQADSKNTTGQPGGKTAQENMAAEKFSGGKDGIPSFDRIFSGENSEETAAKEMQGTEKKLTAGYGVETGNSQEEEDDDVLRALDRYFVYKEKNVGGNRADGNPGGKE